MTEWLYGRHGVEEALRAGRRKISRVLLAEPIGGQRPQQSERLQGIESAALLAKVPVERVPAARLDALTRVGHHHQGVAAEASPFPYATLDEVQLAIKMAGARALVLVLDALQDPQNFGSLLRTADATGVTAVVMLDRRQVEVTPSVVNASAGAVEHLQIHLANNLPRAIEQLQEAGLWVYALQAEEGAVSFVKADLAGPIGLVVGSEGRGVGKLVRERCDGAIALPMLGKVESLNAAVAGSVMLYEALRQRMAAG